MGNLRLTDIKVSDNRTIKGLFTDKLSNLISTGNIQVTSNLPGIPDVEVLSVSIQDNVLVATTQPMTPNASYFVTFKSNEIIKFKSLNGQNYLFEDGKTNVALIVGAEEPKNEYRDEFISSLANNVYDLSFPTLIRKFINNYTSDLQRASSDIGQLKNDNYLSKLIVDEKKIRGKGPYDRLDEEGTYEIVRVGKKTTGSTSSSSISFTSIPSGPITLQTTQVVGEKLSAGYGKGNFNGLTLEVNKFPVTKLKSVTIAYSDGSRFIYDIRTYGYQMQNPRYDQEYASTYTSLNNNQFKLNSDVLLNPNFKPFKVGDFVYVNYEYKSLGMVIDATSVTLTQINSSVREPTPPLLSQFSLSYAPIINVNDNILSSGGVSFLDPNANPPFSQTHPAFKYEVPLRYEALPSQPGQFAIDYTAGKVYVYGASSNDGTGNFPPVATYKYRRYFTSNLDYTYNPDTFELAVSPLRNIAGQEAKINFNFENVLVPEVDYKKQQHQEVLDERIENKLLSLNCIRVNNIPITNVFRIYNETSGEVYTPARFNNDKVYFNYNKAPSVLDATRERVSFQNVLNELMFINSERINSLGTRVLTILLNNNSIMSHTEDVIGSSYNSSVIFSKNDLFNKELFYDTQILTPEENTNRLLVNQYQIDYKNGIVYVGVSPTQDQDLGVIFYKKGVISPEHSHVIAVSEVYHSLSFTSGINKTIDYNKFGEGEIYPSTFDYSDERFLNGDSTQSYYLNNNTIKVTDDIKNIRGIYDAYDLNHNVNPINFGSDATFDANIITVSSSGFQKIEYYTITNTNQINVNFISPGIEIASVSSVIRNSDSIQLWDGYGSFINNTITLSNLHSPATGQSVTVIYNVRLNGSCTPIVDYNRGDYFIDYSYLADEILVSYEYGDNCLDFRESYALVEGDTYYVTYKVGALRDALLKNFGSLIDLSIINSFDTSLPRENYRDVLIGALQSFTKGPTIPAIKSIVSNISKIEPQIIEELFEQWSLGTSYLYKNKIKYSNNIQLTPAKFDYGAVINQPGQYISFPVSSNLKLDDGTLETWVIPEWDGIDNDATLTFENIKRDGFDLSQNKIYFGSGSLNPTIKNGKFELNKNDERSPVGVPYAIHTEPFGMFIYYDDVNKRWNILFKDINDGISNHIYSGSVLTTGETYDVKFIPTYGKIDDTLRSYHDKIEFNFNVYDGYLPDAYTSAYAFNGFTFMSDDVHYLFDFGQDEVTNRFSIYKDGRGYLNFEVFDSGAYRKGRKSSYKVSADISDWKSGERHHVATSWSINSTDQKDEMHLFVDGLEVPNIMRYGGRPVASSTNRFRTVNPEYVAGVVPKRTITYNDLSTTAGSNTVLSASIDFTSAGILPGDTVYIKELGFGTYTITSVAGNGLTLNSTVPITLSDARFSVNPYSVVVTSEIDISSNITVSTLRGGVETEIPGLRADIPGYEIYKNLLNQNILTILGDAFAGDQIVIRTLGLNHRRAKDTVYHWGDTSGIIKTQLAPPVNLDAVKIFPIVLPHFVINSSNSAPSLPNYISTITSATQPSNNVEGRTLSVKLSGGNINFASGASVVINGTNVSGPVSETLSFSSAQSKQTTNKFATITSVVVTLAPYNSSLDFGIVEIKEAYSVTYSENNASFPIIRFSYKKQSGTTLTGDGYDLVSDANSTFFDSDVGCILQINSPPSVAGSYKIVERIDNNTIRLDTAPPVSFTNGNYDIYNTTIGRSGFQNGFFFLEKAGSTNVPYPLPHGKYALDYAAYLEIPFELKNNLLAYIGCDINKNHQAKAVFDEFRILSKRLTDTRIGESIAENDYSVTTDYNSLRAFKKNNSTLMLLHFDSKPFTNDSDIWISATREYIQSSSSVNQNFNQSIFIKNNPIIIDNRGILNTSGEGTVEFWVSPKYDTYNDPEERYYFDSAAATIEECVSLTKDTIKLSGRASKIISVRLLSDKYNNGIEYFGNGTIGKDYQTIYLSKPLPYQKVPVIVSYIPSGAVGNRFSILKEKNGYLTFRVIANSKTFETTQPIFWPRNTWHRIRVTFKFNRRDNLDEIRLFADGEERSVIKFGTGILFGTNYLFGQLASGVSNKILVADINFTDTLNQIFIGSDYSKAKLAMARFDNIKISNISKLPLNISGQPKDINYSSNLSLVYPAVSDVYTTYLANFDTFIKQANDFALLKSSMFGNNNFTINVIDSFDIISSNDKIKQILESLIAALKPAQTIPTINYVK